MSGILRNLSEIWRRTSLVQRVVLLAVLLACVGATVFLVGWVSQPDMALLYSRLEPAEAADIVEKIVEAGVPYELADGGTTIRVPRDQVYGLRMTLAKQNLPTGGQAGYELLKDQTFGASPRQIDETYNRAVEGELAKSIQMIDGVARARVKIVPPGDKIWAKGGRKASASILVQMKGGRRLQATSVAAIVHLVAGGVEGLEPEGVVVVDGRGTLYTGESSDASVRGPAGLHTYKAQVESELARKAEDVLEKVLGPGRAVVRVSVDIERSESRTLKETYDKEGQVKKKEDVLEKITSGPGGSKAGGDTESNITTEFDNPKTEMQTSEPAGKILSRTVSAVVDLTPPAPKEGEEGDTAPTLTEEQCKELICKAVGLTDEKDKTDNITVVATKFNQIDPLAAAPADQAGWFTKDFLLEVVRRSSLGILVLGALLALKILGGPKKKKVGATRMPGLPGMSDEGTEGLLPVGEGGEVDPELLRASITHALQENPDEVKRLFLSWVESEKGDA